MHTNNTNKIKFSFNISPDLRFLSIDFLNTFLLTYRVFTDGETVLNALKKVFYEAQPNGNMTQEHINERLNIPGKDDNDNTTPRRTSGASSVSGYCSEGADRDRSMSVESTALKSKSGIGHQTISERISIDDGATWITESVDETLENVPNKKVEPLILNQTTVEISVHQVTPTTPPAHGLSLTTIITTSSSVDTLNGEVIGLNTLSGPSSPSNLSSVTLVGSTGSGCAPNENGKDIIGSREFTYTQAPSSPLPERRRKSNDQENNKVDGKENGPKAEAAQGHKPNESDESVKNVKISETVTVSSKPKIVSALTKSALKDDGSRSTSAQSTPIKSSCNVLQPMSYLTMNRRPSAGTIGVPVAALSQHRRSLQLNSSEGGFGFSKV